MVQSKWKIDEETQEENERNGGQFQETAVMQEDLIDDHGLAILGHRIRKPIFLDEDDE